MQKLSNDEYIATSGSFKNNELKQRIIITCKSLNRASKSQIVKIFSTQDTSNRYVEVICEEHGLIKQHIPKKVDSCSEICKHCRKIFFNKLRDENTILLTKEKYLKKEKIYHVESIDKNTFKIFVKCDKHGVSERVVKDRVNIKHACLKCAFGSSKLLSTFKKDEVNTMLKDISKKFNLKISSFTNGMKITDKLDVECLNCNSKWKTSPYFLRNAKAPCRKCFELSQRLTTEKFIEKANKKHNFKYNYSKTVYTKSHEKVEIICPEHGSFFQTAYRHISEGNGCPKCANKIRSIGGFNGWASYYKRNGKESGILYVALVDILGKDYIKVGITKYNTCKRFSNGIINLKEELFKLEGELKFLSSLEFLLHTKFQKNRGFCGKKFSGYTEVYPVDYYDRIMDFIKKNNNEVIILEKMLEFNDNFLKVLNDKNNSR